MYSSLKSIKQAIETGEALRGMAQIYGEIALGRLSRIRAKIEKNRAFAAQLADLFAKVRRQSPAPSDAGQSPAPSDAGQSPAPSDAGVYLVLTSREKFFTGLESDLWRFFDRETSPESSRGANFDLLVVGPGKASHQVKNITLAKDLPSSAELTALTAQLLIYDRVMIFYPRFRTLTSQEMVMTEIGEGVTMTGFHPVPAGVRPEEDLYILEPEVSSMLAFFRQQVVRILLEQTFLEAELARTAARMVFMNEVQGRAKDYIANHRRMLMKEVYARREKQILETSLSFLWAKKTLDNLP